MLTEKDLFANVIGKPVVISRFEALARKNLGEYIVYSTNYMDNEDYRKMFAITDRQYRIWEYNGISLDIYISLSNGVITQGRVRKYREGAGGHGRPVIHDLVPTQQELRIVRRVLTYIAES